MTRGRLARVQDDSELIRFLQLKVYDFIVYPAGIYSSVIVDQIAPNATMSQTLGYDVLINAFYVPGTLIGALVVDKLGPKVQ